MTTPSTSALHAVERLRRSLETVAAAVVGANLPELLGAEAELSAALASVHGVVDVTDADRLALVAELRQAQFALRRCRSLGAAISYVTDATLAAHGHHDQYDSAGLAAPPLSSPSSMNVRA